MVIKNINKKSYNVCDDEFKKINHEQYNNLKLIEKVAYFETCYSILKDLSNITDAPVKNLYIINLTHGGFIAINVSSNYNNIFYKTNNKEHLENIRINQKYFNIDNMIHAENCVIIPDNPDNPENNVNQFHVIFDDSTELNSDTSHYTNADVIISTRSFSLEKYESFFWKTTGLNIFVKNNIIDNFKNEFHYYINENDFVYDNLNNLCIMVKNGGKQFEQMLLDNIDNFDEWTILDTGSTDDTLNIINKVLVGKKKGNLYQEPFINFRDSRNRLLDLAGTRCKYITMLDDTYVIKGNLREFLTLARNDQYSDSFTLFIHSHDTSYGSNRIIKAASNLRYLYKIHEVITDKNNINVIIPEDVVYVEDRVFDYMTKRTNDRKDLDLKLLYEELDDNPQDPRTYYYLAQTYFGINDFERAFYYFNKRCEFINSGFLQERFNAAFECARIANFNLNKSWNECYDLYMRAYKIDETRPEPLYFIGIHYYLKNDFKSAYVYLKKAYEIGYPIKSQYCLKPTLSFYFVPKFLTFCCYYANDFILGENVASFFLKYNTPECDDYNCVLSWYNIFIKLNNYKGEKIASIPNKPILCFVADGGFDTWSGSNIIKTGVGGAETYIIEMAKNIQLLNYFDVYVFCNTPNQQEEIFDGVTYRHLNYYYEFINTTVVHTCIVSRFSEYIPLTCHGFAENVYLVVHDLTTSGNIIPIHPKLKNIFCLTEWHVEHFTSFFPDLKNITVPFYHGIDDKLFSADDCHKINYKFIYSSYPNRGLLHLLEMWPHIYTIQPLSTLHIYSDVYNKWSNDVEPRKMARIKELLNTYLSSDHKYGIHYYGWVSKKELADAWKSSHIWFYPCTFMETFCITALEAARTKTLVITSNTAALKNTVANRGFLIDGDPSTTEWQSRAIDLIKNIFSTNTLKHIVDNCIQSNFNWSLSLTWKKQSELLLNQFIFKHDLQYRNRIDWTNDLHSHTKQNIIDILHHFNTHYHKSINKHIINILEIGTYTGTSIIYMIQHVNNSVGYALENWNDKQSIYHSFKQNLHARGIQDNLIQSFDSTYTTQLIEFIRNSTVFDIISICGHNTYNNTDIILSWDLLHKGGLFIIHNSNTISITHLLDINKYNNYNILYNMNNYILLQKT